MCKKHCFYEIVLRLDETVLGPINYCCSRVVGVVESEIVQTESVL